jgi:hypothetical protein
VRADVGAAAAAAAAVEVEAVARAAAAMTVAPAGDGGGMGAEAKSVAGTVVWAAWAAREAKAVRQVYSCPPVPRSRSNRTQTRRSCTLHQGRHPAAAFERGNFSAGAQARKLGGGMGLRSSGRHARHNHHRTQSCTYYHSQVAAPTAAMEASMVAVGVRVAVARAVVEPKAGGTAVVVRVAVATAAVTVGAQVVVTGEVEMEVATVGMAVMMVVVARVEVRAEVERVVVGEVAPEAAVTAEEVTAVATAVVMMFPDYREEIASPAVAQVAVEYVAKPCAAGRSAVRRKMRRSRYAHATLFSEAS